MIQLATVDSCEVLNQHFAHLLELLVDFVQRLSLLSHDGAKKFAEVIHSVSGNILWELLTFFFCQK